MLARGKNPCSASAACSSAVQNSQWIDEHSVSSATVRTASISAPRTAAASAPGAISRRWPVAGVAVRFAIQSGAGGGSASFGTQSVATVTTNAAGRAVAPQMQAIGNGAFRIDVQASYQGRVATTSITQTNYLRAADVPAGRSVRAGEPGSSATSGALSNAGTIAGIGAAAVGGTLAVKQSTQASCDSTRNKALDDLELARAACSPQSGSCQSTAQRAASSLGDWCSCGNRGDVDATVRGAQGFGLADLAQAGVLVGVAMPTSCQ